MSSPSPSPSGEHVSAQKPINGGDQEQGSNLRPVGPEPTALPLSYLATKLKMLREQGSKRKTLPGQMVSSTDSRPIEYRRLIQAARALFQALAVLFHVVESLPRRTIMVSRRMFDDSQTSRKSCADLLATVVLLRHDKLHISGTDGRFRLRQEQRWQASRRALGLAFSRW